MSQASLVKAHNIATSAGTSRLNRILDQPSEYRVSYVPDLQAELEKEPEFHQRYQPKHKLQSREEVKDPKNEMEVGRFVGRVVVPQLRVDMRSIGGTLKLPKKNMIQESLVCMRCRHFDLSSDKEAIYQIALEQPDQYAKHKRSLGFGGGTKSRSKLRYVALVRSTNRALLRNKKKNLRNRHTSRYLSEVHDDDIHPHAASLHDDVIMEDDDDDDDDDDASYDRMYRPEDSTNDGENGDDNNTTSPMKNDNGNSSGPGGINGNSKKGSNNDSEKKKRRDATEMSSFPALVCMNLNPDGTNPDVRKLIPLDQLTTVQNVSTGSVIQLVFADGDTVKIDFAMDESSSDMPSSSLRKERFVWSLLQIHAMLCTSVVERTSLGSTGYANSAVGGSTGNTRDRLLQPLNVRNLDRAELQYVSKLNGFLRDSPALIALLFRQKDIGMGHHDEHGDTFDEDEKKDEMDVMAYDMMMGRYSTRVKLFSSAEERADAEEVLNETAFETSDESEAAAALAKRLQARMNDLEEQTCRKLIAWEDEKHYSIIGQQNNRDSEDSMSLESLFRTLDLLDRELKSMESWLHERAAVIKPLTDDCRDIEEENRQLEQQWKSYDMLGAELRRLLTGVGIPKDSEKILKNPASALTYDGTGQIDIEASEPGVDKIHHAGKALKDAMENAKGAGGVHLRAVNERVEDLVVMSDTFCTALAQIIVTVMEQIKTDVMIASDNGKVSKSDTHSMIAKKIRDVSNSRAGDNNCVGTIPNPLPFFSDSTSIPVVVARIHEAD